MTEPINKSSLLNEMQTNYAALVEIISPLDNAQMTTEGVIPGWSIKDILAHITSWHLRLLTWLNAAIRNQQPTISGPESEEEMNALNAQFYQENKSLSLDEALTNFRITHQQITEWIQSMLEEDLINPNRFAWLQGQPLWQLVAGDTYEHYQEHKAQIKAWLATSNNA
jgi:hypothetical protein